MQRVPKIVSQRLRSQRLEVSAAAPNHPDADVLTAFAEQSLPELERAVVLEHLGRCVECRDVIALALPGLEAAPLAAGVPERRRWLAWPVVRWGFAAAGVAIIALLGVVRLQKHAPEMTAYKAAPAAVEARNQADSLSANERSANEREDHREEPARVAGGVAGASSKKKKEQDLAQTQPPLSEVRPARNVAANTSKNLAHGPEVSNQWQQLNANNAVANYGLQKPVGISAAPAAPAPASAARASAPAQAPPAAVRSVQVEAQNPAVQTESQNAAVENVIAQNQPVETPASQVGHAESKVDRAKPAGDTVYNSGAKVLGGPESSALQGSMTGSVTRWTISSAGTLQRSFDQGNTWRDVSVIAGAPAFANGYMYTAAKAKTTGPDTTSKDAADLDKKAESETKQSAAPVFRAVSANGSDVWAGGTAGSLYHSIDAGAHWSRIVPSSGGVTLTGDVLAISFKDPQHGTVSTSTLESWSTDDSGLSWTKR